MAQVSLSSEAATASAMKERRTQIMTTTQDLVDLTAEGVFSKADRARRTQVEKRAAERAPTVPGCVCSDWQVVEYDWDNLPTESVSSDMTMDSVSVPPETWIG